MWAIDLKNEDREHRQPARAGFVPRDAEADPPWDVFPHVLVVASIDDCEVMLLACWQKHVQNIGTFDGGISEGCHNRFDLAIFRHCVDPRREHAHVLDEQARGTGICDAKARVGTAGRGQLRYGSPAQQAIPNQEYRAHQPGEGTNRFDGFKQLCVSAQVAS
jgi:hypothetical protein